VASRTVLVAIVIKRSLFLSDLICRLLPDNCSFAFASYDDKMRQLLDKKTPMLSKLKPRHRAVEFYNYECHGVQKIDQLFVNIYQLTRPHNDAYCF